MNNSKPSTKQEEWRIRNKILWRIKGSYIQTSFGNVLTERERELIKIINDARHEIILNSIQSSRELGFNAHKRCPYCGRAIKDDEEICKKCLNNGK